MELLVELLINDTKLVLDKLSAAGDPNDVLDNNTVGNSKKKLPWPIVRVAISINAQLIVGSKP